MDNEQTSAETHSNPASQARAPLVTIAVLDDDLRVAKTVQAYLQDLQCRVTVFTDPAECVASMATTPPDILVTDLRMPGTDGIKVLGKVKGMSSTTEVIILSGAAEKKDAILALRLGAFDFFEKPIRQDDLVRAIQRTLKYRNALRERDLYAEQVSLLSAREAERWGLKAFGGSSAAVREITRSVRLVQQAAGTSVMITGESGTGKELIARAIHFGSPRASRPFVPVNCAAVPAELAESTFFGHIKGSFTGATDNRKGCFSMAHEGTLFLDEIGDMPLPLQAKLLRVLEDGVVSPVGATAPERVDVRVIAATNSNLQERLRTGAFRSDLYYRIAAYTIAVPPLRQRPEDIPPLVEHFVAVLALEMGFAPPSVQPDCLAALAAHDYPGNVRELRNVIERALIESGGKTLTARHVHFPGGSSRALPPAARAPAATAEGGDAGAESAAMPVRLDDVQALAAKRAMAAANGNVSAAAKLLGINRAKLYRLIARNG